MTDQPDGSHPGDSRLMMTSPKLWNYWPFLPLKRYSGNGIAETAVLYDRTDEGSNKAEFRFLSNYIIVLVTREKMRAAPIADVDDLIANGWVVD